MKKICASILILALTASIFAHEYWIEPDNFFPATGEKNSIRLFVGDGLTKDREEKSFLKNKTTMFRLFLMNKSIDLTSLIADGALPVYNFAAENDGEYLLAMERNWSYIKLEADKFEDYLREDGLDYIIAERKKLGESRKEGRERYSRFLKSLLQIGGKADETFRKRAGLKLEIMPLENPCSKKVGDKLNFQILFDGKPLIGKTVFASNRETEKQKFKTDKNGRISMKIEKSGLWLVHLVFMQRCRIDCAEADWESFWGAFSFGAR